MAKIMCRYFKLNGYYLVTNNTLYNLDFAWLSVALVLLVVSILINKFKKC